MTLADKIVVLRDGRIEQVGAPLDLYDDPDNQFVAGFIGSPRMNFLPAVVQGGALTLPQYGGQVIPLPRLGQKLSEGTKVTVGIRPEHFKSGGSAGLDVRIEIVEHLGGESYAYARAGAADVLTIATSSGRDWAAGTQIKAAFDPAKTLLFDMAGQRLR